MSKAIELAQNESVPKGPNPRVGCVVLGKDGQYLSEGFHQGKGTAHAEVAALAQCGSKASGSTVVVTLEPCYRPDRETDCTRILAESGINKVIFAQSDQTMKSTGGARYLQNHGIEVVGGVMVEEAAGLNPWFTVAMMQQRPYVRVKIASSLDGKVAAEDGTSKWISGDVARAYVHELRTTSHVLISSIKSVIKDNSRLSARDSNGEYLVNQPKVVLIGNEKLPDDHPIRKEPIELEVVSVKGFSEMLDNFWRNQDLSILVEAGPTLTTALLQSGLVNEIQWITAPILLGGSGISAIGDLGVDSISKAIRPHVFQASKLGIDNLTVLQLTAGN